VWDDIIRKPRIKELNHIRDRSVYLSCIVAHLPSKLPNPFSPSHRSYALRCNRLGVDRWKGSCATSHISDYQCAEASRRISSQPLICAIGDYSTWPQEKWKPEDVDFSGNPTASVVSISSAATFIALQEWQLKQRPVSAYQVTCCAWLEDLYTQAAHLLASKTTRKPARWQLASSWQ
jgi:hypothetical protein